MMISALGIRRGWFEERPTAVLQRVGWVLIGLGAASWCAGRISFDFGPDRAGFPALWDLFYAAAFLTFLLGIGFLARAAAGAPVVWLRALAAAIGVAALASALIWLTGDVSGGERAFASRAYPVLAASLAVFAFSLATASGRARRMWVLLGLAFTFGAGARAVGAGLIALPAAAGTAMAVAIVALVVAAALSPPDRVVARTDSPAGLVPPAVLGLISLGVMVWDHFRQMPITPFALAAASVLGIMIGLLLTLAEIRLRKAREAQMIRRVAHAERLCAVGRLAGGVTHDFNNVLSVIATSADGAVDAPGVPEPARQEMRRVLKAARRGSTMTDQLMRFSRGESTPAETVVVDRELADLAPLLRRTLGAGGRLRVELGAGDAAVALRPGELDRIVMNLVANCRDALAPSGGHVAIETSLHPLDDGGEGVRLIVRDDGEGMSEEVAARALEPFFTTKPVGSGTGVGLTSVNGIVRSAGGRIRLDSSPGQGTEVEVGLPC